MNIYRSAAQRYRGRTTIIPSRPIVFDSKLPRRSSITWDSILNQFSIVINCVPHDDRVTTHDYTLMLTIDDVSSLAFAIDKACCGADASKLRDMLKNAIPALLNILSVANGYIPGNAIQSKSNTQNGI